MFQRAPFFSRLRINAAPEVGAGTRSRIQARLSGMNIYYARTSKLVSDFLYLERRLVHTLAQLGWLRTESQADWAVL